MAASASQARASNVVMIGYAGALTGPQAHLGKDVEHGIELAIDEINASHPVIAGVPTTFKLDAEDDAGDPRIATLIAQRFIDSNVNAVIGHQSSGTSIAVARLYAAANIAEITPSATNPQFTQLGYRTTFRVIANDNFLGTAMSRYLIDTMHARRVAVIDDRSAYGQGLADVFVDATRRAGGTIVAREYTTDKTVDFSSALTLFKDKRPDAIFFGGVDAQAGPMLRQMKKLGVAVPLLGGDGLCTHELPQLAGDALAGNLYCADGGLSLAAMPGGPSFDQRFQARYGQHVQLYAPYAYDAMMAVYHAVVQTQSAQPAKIVDALRHVEFQGVTGQVAFDNAGDLRISAATISTFKERKKMTLLEIKR
ncbi:Leucine-, isoleucine-, valine-, threonine-, and alanine-binding protein [Paraburkholderia metrosideri]|jgi:branched-chain amino acid transport system substrate-binding protein|uniref:Leucine-, isoleucine-, valine-, threonine-, and alanine-binding protein n=2 Tax=Paraburkholderia metrosideri TaxID=580937 RepID=A0ABN7IBD5_9BURK|nr:Leucine-, isoleucine-, valine-, threonine-, and alanine-binding protein [Paraburkholderia metrosideri]